MKKNLLKRIGAVALAVAVSLTMGVTSFAAKDTVGDATIESTSSTVTIPKGIIVTNPENIKVFGPAVNYTFTVGNATPTAGATITTDVNGTTEGNNTTVTVKPGVDGGVTVQTQPSFADAGTAASVGTNGIELVSNLVLNININAFTSAGVYRYVVTDATTADTLNGAAITRESGYSSTRYLDVYINNSDSGLVVAGHTLLKENTKDVTGDNDVNVKSPGFISGSEKNDAGVISTKGSEKSDYYNTINVYVEKEVTGAMGDKQHDFPFDITLTDVGSTYYFTKAVDADVQGDSATALAQATTLKDGEKYIIKGLKPTATVLFKETNNTNDIYDVTASSGDLTYEDASTTPAVSSGKYAQTSAMTISNYETYETQNIAVDTKNGNVKFTNNLGQISPTNVVMRFAPYLFIIGAAIVLLVLMRRRRASRDTE